MLGRIFTVRGRLGCVDQTKDVVEKEPRIEPDGRVVRGILRVLPFAIGFWIVLGFLLWWIF